MARSKQKQNAERLANADQKYIGQKYNSYENLMIQPRRATSDETTEESASHHYNYICVVQLRAADTRKGVQGRAEKP